MISKKPTHPSNQPKIHQEKKISQLLVFFTTFLFKRDCHVQRRKSDRPDPDGSLVLSSKFRWEASSTERNVFPQGAQRLCGLVQLHRLARKSESCFENPRLKEKADF